MKYTMKHNRCFVFLCLALGLASCAKDLGNYEYKDVNEVTFEGIASTYSVSNNLDMLEISPVVKMTMADPSDTTRFEYTWDVADIYNSHLIIAKTKDVSWLVSTPAIKTYDLFFKVYDRETQVTWLAASKLAVGTPYTKGLLLMGEDAQGNADVQMISMVKEPALVKDVLGNSGMEPHRGGIDVLHTGNNNPNIWVMTQQGAFSLDPKTMKATANNAFEKRLFLSYSLSAPLVPVDIAPRVRNYAGDNSSSGNRCVVCQDGSLFVASMTLNGGEYYTDPVNRLEESYGTLHKAKPFLMYSMNGFNSLVWYDGDNERFLQVASTFDAHSRTLTDNPGDPFPWDQASVGRTLVYAENTYNTDGGSASGNSFALMKDRNNQYYIYKFYVGSGPSKRDAYTIGAKAKDFDKATFYAFSSRRTVLYYTVGAKLYAYDYNKGNESLTEMNVTGGDEITMLRFDLQMDPNENALFVATYNSADGGRLQRFTQGTNPDKIELTKDTSWDWKGLTKVKTMSWRGK